MDWLTKVPHDRLTWQNSTNLIGSFYTEVQSRTGTSDWRVRSIVSLTNAVTLPRDDARVVRYRVRHVYPWNGKASDWCYKSTR
jgi:hypothetical protein